jgi:glycosyltransferase involved in cell wall biosynthesis
MNCAETLKHCLSSVTSQTYQKVELLIADGGSVDGTCDIIASFEDRIEWYESAPDKGIYDAWNKAIRQSSGDWICFLGADDAFSSPDALSSVVQSLCAARKAGIDLVYTLIDEVSASGQLVSRLGLPPEGVAWQLKHGMPRHMPHTGMFHSRKLFEVNGLYSAEFRIAGDYEFLLRSVGVNPAAFRLHEGVLVEKGTNGVSFRHQVETIREFHKARRLNGMPGFTLPWFLIYSRAIIRRWYRGLGSE